MSDTTPTVADRRFWNRRGLWLAGGVLAVVAAVASVAPVAWAFRGFSGHSFGGHGFGGHRGHFGMLLTHDPAAAKQHAGMAIEFALRGVNANDEQKQQARRIAERLIDELGPLAEQHHEHHQALVRELGKAQIDRAAIEQLRKQELALADQASKAALGAVTELADVLTPEQRNELIDFARRFHGSEAPTR
jgi:Spy/CpxP family protein refolding chaperone